MAQTTRRRKATGEAATRGTVRLNVAIPSDAWERLALHSTMTRRTQADIITELVETHLRSYRVQFIGPKESVRPDESAPVAPPEVSAAAARHAARTGRVRASGEEQARRWSLCRACDHFRPSDSRCGKADGCGCYLAGAIPIEAKRCPVGKW